jgi:actin-related protein
LLVGSSAELTLQATASSNPTLSGVVLESGEQLTTATPVVRGHVVPHAIQRLSLAGDALTDWMEKLLHLSGHGDLAGRPWRDVIREIKETLTYTALDYDAEVARAQGEDLRKVYESPGGGPLATIDVARFRCPEVLFQPQVMGLDAPGVHSMVHAAVSACDGDLAAELYGHVLLTGGSMAFPGLAARLQRELDALNAAAAGSPLAKCLGVIGATVVNVVEVKGPLPNVSAWAGGSIVGQRSDFDARCILKSEYDALRARG